MEINEQTIDIFKSEVEHFAQIDRMIVETKHMMKPYQDRLKQLKLERKELEKDLCEIMDINDIKKTELPNNSGVLEYQIKQAIVPMTQKTVKEKMIDFFIEGPGSQLSFNSQNPKLKGMEIFNYIYGKENREFVKKEVIKAKDLKL